MASHSLEANPEDVWLLDLLPYGLKSLGTKPEAPVRLMMNSAEIIIHEKFEFVLYEIKLWNV